MRNKRLADAIIENAIKYHSEDCEYPPSLVIDKQDYSDFDIDIVKAHLEKEGFVLIDGTLAPEPFAQMDEDFKSKKWYIYQVNVLKK